MKVVRSTTFQNGTIWEKIEVELDSSDLLPEEQIVPDHAKAQLLELRIDKHITMHLLRHGQLTKDEAAAKISELDGYRNTLLKLKPAQTLRRRGVGDA
jgi:hypothetical protein